MYITYLIMGLTVLVSFSAWNRPQLMSRLIMNPYAISKKNQIYRFVTSGFIHQDHMHLILNMFSLYFFGIAVELVFNNVFGASGNLYFILLYVSAIIVSDLPSYFKHKNNPRYASLGASGGVSAIIFAFIIFEPLQSICIYIALCMPGFILGTGYILFSWYQGRKAKDNINHDAHLYGALFGFIFCIIVYPASIGQFFDQIRNWDFLQNLF
jgi:membrane associated rhomboid family serine protease